jgi:hypothetical protein
MKELSNIRTCTKCKIIKSVEEFYKDKRVISDGRTSVCIQCKLKYTRQYISDNIEKYRTYWLVRKLDFPEKIKSVAKKYRDTHKEKRRIYETEWRHNHIEESRRKLRMYAAKRHSTVKGNLEIRMATSIYRSLKGNKQGRSWEKLVGFTANDLMKHLEKKFLPGMSWDNMGEWHIDHKIPKVMFNYNRPEDIDFRRCWALKNLQPLWAIDNNRKYSKLKEPFQPSLTL